MEILTAQEARIKSLQAIRSRPGIIEILNKISTASLEGKFQIVLQAGELTHDQHIYLLHLGYEVSRYYTIYIKW